MSQLRDTIRAAIAQADKAYEEAIKSRELLDELRAGIPSNGYLFQEEIRETQEEAVRLVASAYDIKHDLEVMEEDLHALKSVRGE